VAETPKYSSHRGNSSNRTRSTVAPSSSEEGDDDDDDESSIRKDDNTRGSNDESKSSSHSQTRLKDVFSCAQSISGAAGDLQVKNNMEVFLDGLVNGFWQCPGGVDDDIRSVATGNATMGSTASGQAASCQDIFGALTQSTQQMEFQFVPNYTNYTNTTKSSSSSSLQRSEDTIPPLPSSSSSSGAAVAPTTSAAATATATSKQSQAAKRKATGKMFKRIRVKRGENIGMELFEHNKSVYISRVAKDGTGLKRGMRIIAINDHPCPDSVGEAIELLGMRVPHDDGYVTFVTGEEYDFESAAASVVSAGDNDNNNDNYSIRSSTGYV